jgi:hypothetical protein
MAIPIEVPASAAAVVVRVAVGQARQELLDQRPAERSRGRLLDTDLAARDPSLDLLQDYDGTTGLRNLMLSTYCYYLVFLAERTGLEDAGSSGP